MKYTHYYRFEVVGGKLVNKRRSSFSSSVVGRAELDAAEARVWLDKWNDYHGPSGPGWPKFRYTLQD